MLCPSCDKNIEPISRAEIRNFNVRGEDVDVEDHFLSCPECNEQWSADGFDFAAEAYRAYRARHHLLQPEEMKAFRKSLHLTQEELARLLGWSEATINRYEKGALQEKSHDNAFRMLMTREGLLSLLDGRDDILPEQKIKRIKENLVVDIPELIEPNIATTPSVMTGFRSFSWSKLRAIVAILCEGRGVWKTNLNKLLWYADLLHFKRTSMGITGLQYIRHHYGPVAKDFQWLFAYLVEKDFESEIIEFPDYDITGEKIKLANKVDTSILTEEEKDTIIAVREKLKGLSAKAISDISHEEKAWLETPPKELISYNFAEDIKLSI